MTDKEFIQQGLKYINKIKKNLKNNQVDYTIQISLNSVSPEKIYYSAQIEAPANGLQPLTWIKESKRDLIDALKNTAEGGLNADDVEKAWHMAEITRAKTRIAYHEEAIKEIENHEKDR